MHFLSLFLYMGFNFSKNGGQNKTLDKTNYNSILLYRKSLSSHERKLFYRLFLCSTKIIIIMSFFLKQIFTAHTKVRLILLSLDEYYRNFLKCG